MSEEVDTLDSDWRALLPARRGGRGRVSDLTGMVFGKLRVLKRAGSDVHGTSLWRCRCSCGKSKVVSKPHLKQGRVKSCGCLGRNYRSSSHKGCTAPLMSVATSSRYDALSRDDCDQS